LTIDAGSIVCSNVDGSVLRTRSNTASVTVTWANIDTGSEAGSTTYYVYAVADADLATFTAKISLSATVPTGVTYYRLLGSFYNDASSNVLWVKDGIVPAFGGWVDKSGSYGAQQAETDGFVLAGATCPSYTSIYGYTDSNANPTTVRQEGYNANSNTDRRYITMPVKKGDYWKITISAGAGIVNVYWISSGS
jgi:hypothetical protein